MAEFNKRVETVEECLTSLEEKFTDKINCEHDTLQINEVIEQLKEDINEREQMLLLNDIQIDGVPETECAEQAGSRRFPPAGEERHRPQPVIVWLARRALRDEIIKSARVRRNTDTSDVIDGNPSRVYINKHLTRNNRILFYKAREEGKRHGWHYTWTRDGKIYMRRETSSAVQRIRLFNPGSLGTHHDEFVVLMERHMVDIIALNESWLRPGEDGRAPRLPGYRLRHIPRPTEIRSRGGGVGFYIKRGISARGVGLQEGSTHHD
ncbi:unnamed protein product [Euphydryas editha]|uniref:FP protein C-terminal domain-containing protein n=1 Tax=Euphydryas editha TaxID=104508 RepID=A0AAU9VCT3_EUPED|nr:unnamed protein product [Euphydryas editha]